MKPCGAELLREPDFKGFVEGLEGLSIQAKENMLH